MKNLIFIISILFFSCGKTKNNIDVQKNNIYKKGIMNNTYFLNYDLSGDFDIIFNGYCISRNKKDGVKMSFEYLNPYISKSGKQTITLSLKPLHANQKLDPKVLSEIYLEVYLSKNGEQPPFEKIHILKLPKYEGLQDSILYTWTFDADVPFEINTLADAKVLTKENPETLLREVLVQYKNVHDLINDGNIKDYMNLYKKSREREMISMYYDETKQKEYLKGLENRAISSKGFMQPLTDYKLLIHPNNKIISLVNSQGKTPLFSKDDKGKIKTYGVQLYRSIKTGKLEVY